MTLPNPNGGTNGADIRRIDPANPPKCELCGEPMPPGESMFKFHGYSGPCPKPPVPKPNDRTSGCPIHGAEWCTCRHEADPSPAQVKAAARRILDSRLRHTDDCAVHSPTLRPCSCGLETRLRQQLAAAIAERDEAARDRDLYKDDFERQGKRLNAALDELRCPDCGCADEVDAQSQECGCDSPLCAREGGETLAQWAIGLLAQRDALAAVVGRLPVTADGVPVVPGMVVQRVCVDDGPGRPCEPFTVRYKAEMKLRDDPYAPSLGFDADPVVTMWRDCYSTREAAAAALAALTPPKEPQV